MRKPAIETRSVVAKRTKESTKVARKAAASQVAAKAAKPRKTAPKSLPKSSARRSAKPALLAGGNPQIAKAYGDAPVQAYIAAMPGWKRDVGRRLDAFIVRNVPNVRKAVKWNSPFYGVEGEREEGAWFLSFHCFTKYVKLAFFRGAARRCAPSRRARPSTSRCATSTSTSTTRSTKHSSPPG
jgi:hypothetical protein